MHCNDCNTEVSGNQCLRCGKPSSLPRIDSRYILRELEHAFHFEKGILYTVRELALRPGDTVKNFIENDRSRLVKPLAFLIITSALYSLIDHYFHLFEESMGSLFGASNFKEVLESPIGVVNKWMVEHYSYGNLIQGFFLAFFLKLFFRRSAYNYFEILVFVLFISGMGMLLFSFLGLVQGVTHFDLFIVAAVGYNIYQCWAIGQFLGNGGFGAFTKASVAFFAMVVAFITLTLLFVIFWMQLFGT